MSQARNSGASTPADGRPASGRTLYLIDGHAQIFRAYFAIRGGMSSPNTGESTNAVFGFAGMLLNLYLNAKPDLVAMAIDMPGKTFRDEMYPEYKATREPLPDDFLPQEQRIFEMCRMFGIPLLGVSSAEADDVIATIVHRMRKKYSVDELAIRIVSRDKDLEQLLAPGVVMYDIHTDVLVDEERLLRDKGIRPDQVVDVLAMAGDKVDNIPGVDGVGVKTAAKLVNEFGSMENLLANLDKVKGKRKQRLEEAAEHLPLSKKLVTLNDAVDIAFELDDAELGPIDGAGLKQLFEQLGFNRHQRDLERLINAMGGSTTEETGAAMSSPAMLEPGQRGGGGSAGDGFAASLFDVGGDGAATGGAAVISGATNVAPADAGMATAADCDYQMIATAEELDDVLAAVREVGMVSVDCETVGLGPRSAICGVCLAWKPEHAVYVPMLSPEPERHLSPEEVLERLRPMLADESIPKVGHNIKYDALVLRRAGAPLRGVHFDTMIAAFLLELPARGLDALAASVLKHRMIPISSLIGEARRGVQQRTMDTVALAEATPYGAEDADVTLRLHHVLAPQLESHGMQELSERVEMPLVEVLAEMEHHGIRVDPDELISQKTALASRITELRDAIHEAAGEAFNVDSPKQLGEVLFKKLKLPVIKRTKTGPSTDVEVLEKLVDHEDVSAEQAVTPRLVVEYRQLTKLTNTYLVALGEAIDADTGRVHASFHQTGAATGRLSSSGPNLQNIPVRTDLGRQVRKAFVAEAGHVLISADYSQIELRILAHLSRDKGLVDAFNANMDIHTAVAAEVFKTAPDAVTREQRGHAKTINFGIIYGVTPYGLARRIEGLDVKGAKALIADYRARFSGIDTFLDACVAQAEKLGYVTTMMGRRRRIAQIKSPNGATRALGQRLAINSVVQGSAADLIKLAMVNLHRRIMQEQLPLKMLLQIHDELVLEAPEDAAAQMQDIVRSEMEQAMQLRVPLVVEAGASRDWFDAK